MDIVDIILAKKLTPQGQIETYARTSQQAVANANAAVAAVEAAAEDIEEKQSAAQDLLEQAQEALETAREAQIAMPEVYDTTGQNTDGYMTQKAVTDALDTKATIVYVNNGLSNKVDNSTLNNYATTTYVNQKIASIPSSGMPSGVSNLGIDNAGKIVVIGSDGNITSGETTEEDIIEALIKAGIYNVEGTSGISIDYQNRSFEKTQDAVELNPGADFNQYSMYGGRMRCNVADDGTINAFYGDPTYTEDGSNGQVMIYQPKFYYQRILIDKETSSHGTIVRKESLAISPVAAGGFKLHPLFKNGEEELDYVLLSAFEGSVFDTSNNSYITNNGSNIDMNEDKLSSIAGVKPLSGSGKNINLGNLKTLAQNRGTGWQITNMQFESALQMLITVEFGNMNGQLSLGKGIVNIPGNISNGGAITGSTSSLGNTSGIASSTIFDNNGSQTTYSTEDTCAISYRGMENPWGNLWRIIGNCSIKGDGSKLGGVPYIDTINSLQFQLPSGASNWISNMAYSDTDYDWIYMPIECNEIANSAVPIGDKLWTGTNLNGERMVAIGGYFKSTETGGLYAYNTEATINAAINYSNARLMYIPTKNSIYTANIAKWQQKYGG